MKGNDELYLLFLVAYGINNLINDNLVSPEK